MVRGLRNSRAPISGFDRPSRASRAICCFGADLADSDHESVLPRVAPLPTESQRDLLDLENSRASTINTGLKCDPLRPSYQSPT